MVGAQGWLGLTLFKYLSNPHTSLPFSFHDLNPGPRCFFGQFQQPLVGPCIPGA